MIVEILVNVSFLKHTLIKSDAGVVEGDYNTTKLVFNFEEDVSEGKILFKMSDPNGTPIFLYELTSPEVTLVGYDEEGNPCSLFNGYGLYPFELVWYGDNGKITSAPGWMNVSKRQVPIADSGDIPKPGEDIPDYREVADFTIEIAGLEEELEVSYSVSEKVALPAGCDLLASVSDGNFKASNIKKGVKIFGLEGDYEGGGGEDIPDHTNTDFTLSCASREGAIDVVYSSTEKSAFEAAPNGAIIDSFVDTHFLPQNIKKDVEIFGITGTYEGEGEVLPEISEPLTLIASKEGADEGELVIAYNLSQKSALPAGTNAPLGFVKDANFLPKNIKKDEIVFGLRGEYEGEGGGGEQPQLYAPTITLAGASLIIHENENNGTFTTSYGLYIDGSLVGNYTSTTIDLSTLGLADGEHTITVRAKGTDFADSANSATVIYDPSAKDAGLYQNGTLVKTWEQVKTSYPTMFETEGTITVKNVSTYDSNTYHPMRSVNGELVISSDITTLGKNALYNCGLNKIVIPDSVTEIGERACSVCPQLTEVSIGKNVKSIGNDAFNQSEKLTAIILPEGLESIGNSAFHWTEKVTSVTIPASVKTIGILAFCKQKTITFLGTPETIGDNAFMDATTINVPWSAGAVAGAPWGATSARINYNYVAEG